MHYFTFMLGVAYGQLPLRSLQTDTTQERYDRILDTTIRPKGAHFGQSETIELLAAADDQSVFDHDSATGDMDLVESETFFVSHTNPVAAQGSSESQPEEELTWFEWLFLGRRHKKNHSSLIREADEDLREHDPSGVRRIQQRRDKTDTFLKNLRDVPVAFFKKVTTPDAAEVFETAKGIFWDAPSEAIWGTAEMVLSPIETAEGIYIAVTNPRDTLQALKAQLGQTIDHGSLQEQGQLAGDVLMVFIPGPKFFDKLKKLREASRNSKAGQEIVNELRRSGAENPRLVLVREGGTVVEDLGDAKKISPEAVELAKDTLRSIPHGRGFHTANYYEFPAAADRFIKEVEDVAEVTIHKGTTEARRRLYKNNRDELHIENPNRFDVDSKHRSLGFFAIDPDGKPVIVLRGDARRITLLEEGIHALQFKRFRERSLALRPHATELEIKDAWKAQVVNDKVVHAAMEVEAHKRVIKYLEDNGGSIVEKKEVKYRLEKIWIKRLKSATGKDDPDYKSILGL